MHTVPFVYSKECEGKVFTLSDEAQLEACGITGCRPLPFVAEAVDASAPGAEEIGGRTIAAQTSAGRSCVILMRNDYPADAPPAFVCASRICILYHELGHVRDMREGINFNHATMAVDLEGAEKYADAFAKEKLKQIKCRKLVDGKEYPATLWEFWDQVRHIGNYVDSTNGPDVQPEPCQTMDKDRNGASGANNEP